MGGAGDEGLTDADQEDGDQQCAQCALVGHDGHREGGQEDGTSQLHGDHQPAPIAAIDECTSGQRHQQPGEAGGHGHRHHQAGVVGEAGRQQRKGRQHQAIADAGHTGGELHQTEGSPQRGATPPRSFHQCLSFKFTRWVKKPSGPEAGVSPVPSRSVMLVNRRSSWLWVATADRAYRSWGSPDRGEPHVQQWRSCGTSSRVVRSSATTVGGVGDDRNRSTWIERRRCRDDARICHDPHPFRRLAWSIVRPTAHFHSGTLFVTQSELSR